VLKLVVDVLDQSLRLLPDAWQTENWLGVHIPGLGAILTVVIVLLTGLFATNFFGAQLFEIWHDILHRIPVVNSIYSSVKQISDTLFSSSGQAFRKTLLVQWPRENMWTIAFLTGLPVRLRAHHPQPDRRLFCHRRPPRRDRARHDRRPGLEVHHFHGRGAAAGKRTQCEPITAVS
jgi:uncharacterized membrane protein